MGSRSRRLFVHDRLTKAKYLTDSGAEISVTPPTAHERRNTSKKNLFAANGSHISTYGERQISLDLGLRRNLKWPFTVANVQYPIIGADFLENFGLLIDLKNKRLIDTTTSLSQQGSSDGIKGPTAIYLIDPSHRYANILHQYPNLLKENPAFHDPDHEYHHVIVTKGPPVSARPRRLPPDKLAQARQEFQHMVDLGICRPSKSAWSSPLHLVQKKYGS